MLKEKLDSRKCFATAWGKLITEEEAYRQLNRQIAAMTLTSFSHADFRAKLGKTHRRHLRHCQYDEYGSCRKPR